jgi:hypothetical protein
VPGSTALPTAGGPPVSGSLETAQNSVHVDALQVWATPIAARSYRRLHDLL